MNAYESILVFKPQTPPEEIDKVLNKLEKMITTATRLPAGGQGGEVISCDKWGVKKMAYPIKRNKEGFLVYLNFKCESNLVNEIKQTYLVTDEILRSITTRVEKPRKFKAKKKEPPIFIEKQDVETAKEG